MRTTLFVMALVLVFAITAGAQQTTPVVYLSGGMRLPLSPSLFKDGWKTGAEFGGGFGLQFSPQFEGVVMASYASLDTDPDGMLEWAGLAFLPAGYAFDVVGGKFTTLEIMVEGRYIIKVGTGDSPFRPYLVGAVGIGSIKFEEATVTLTTPTGTQSETAPEDTETKIAFGGGFGFQYMFSPKVGAWIEARYMSIAATGDPLAFLPLRGGLKLEFGK